MFLTNTELNNRAVTHERLLSIVGSLKIKIARVRVDKNNYGEFLFVDVLMHNSRLLKEQRVTFYGLGYHEIWKRIVSDCWGFYVGDAEETSSSVSGEETKRCIHERREKLPPHDNLPTKIEGLATMLGLHGDVDGFLSMCDDFPLLRSLETCDKNEREQGQEPVDVETQNTARALEIERANQAHRDMLAQVHDEEGS
jgi:hypothetical protein